MKNLVLVIGGGALGKAIASRIKTDTYNVCIWDKDESRCTSKESLPEILAKASFVFFCVPSWSMRHAMDSVHDVSSESVLVSFAKGIEEKEGKSMHELFLETFPKNPHAICYGPMLAEEIEKGLWAGGVCATRDISVFKKVESVFDPKAFHLTYSSDMLGISFLGPLKNIYVMALGIADGLKLGNNLKGWVVTQALFEISSILRKLGGNDAETLTLAGVGDFVATGFSPHSRNRMAGEEMARTGACCIESEGIASLPHLIQRLRGSTDSLPLLEALRRVVVGKENPKTVFSSIIP